MVLNIISPLVEIGIRGLIGSQVPRDNCCWFKHLRYLYFLSAPSPPSASAHQYLLLFKLLLCWHFTNLKITFYNHTCWSQHSIFYFLEAVSEIHYWAPVLPVLITWNNSAWWLTAFSLIHPHTHTRARACTHTSNWIAAYPEHLCVINHRQ